MKTQNTTVAKQQKERADLILRNEKLKTCKKEQDKLKRQLIKLGLI